MKQVVTQTFTNKVDNGWNSCSIELAYGYDPDLNGTKEYEDVVVFEDGSKKIVKHWVKVASEVDTSNIEYITRKYVNKKLIAKQKRIQELQSNLPERIKKYQEKIESDLKMLGKNAKKSGYEIDFPDGINPDEDDIRESTELMSLNGRKIKGLDFLRQNQNVEV